MKISRNVNFKMPYRGDFWVFLNAVFWDQQENMSSIESIVVMYRYYRIRLGIDTIELVSILLPSLINTPRTAPHRPSNTIILVNIHYQYDPQMTLYTPTSECENKKYRVISNFFLLLLIQLTKIFFPKKISFSAIFNKKNFFFIARKFYRTNRLISHLRQGAKKKM